MGVAEDLPGQNPAPAEQPSGQFAGRPNKILGQSTLEEKIPGVICDIPIELSRTGLKLVVELAGGGIFLSSKRYLGNFVF
jgi:hypothetical protein